MTSKHLIKALTALCLTVSVAFSLVCCGTSADTSSPIPNVYIYNSAVRVARFETPTLSKGILTAKLAKNESEAMQFVLNFPTEKTNVKVVVSNLVSSGGETIQTQLYRQKYLSAHATENDSLRIYPDALVPMFDGSDGGYKNDLCDMAASENQGYWITVTSLPDQKEGIYTGKVTITFDGGSRVIPVEVEVWSFALPQTPAMQTAYDFWFDSEAVCTGLFKSRVDGIDMLSLKKEFYEFQLKYKLSSGTLPISYDGTAAEIVERIRPYAEDPRVTSFSLPYKMSSTAKPDNWNVELYNALVGAGLTGKAYYYVADANASEDYISRMAAQIKAFSTEIPLLTSSLTTAYIDGQSSFQCVDICSLEDSASAFKLQQQGVKLWHSEAAVPSSQQPSYLITSPLMSARLIRWQQKDYGICGDLYWSTTYFSSLDENGNTSFRDYLSNLDTVSRASGDGMLCYPGLPDDGVVNRLMFMPSIRLEAVRDGIEDYDYLTLIENKLKKSLEALEITDVDIGDIMKMYTKTLYTALDEYDSDPQKLLAMRELLAEDIMKDSSEIVTLLPSYNEEDGGRTLLTVFTKKPSSVFADGKALTGKDMGTYYKYTLLYNNVQGQKINISVNGEEYTRILPKQNDSDYILKFEEKAIKNAVSLGLADNLCDEAALAYLSYIAEQDKTLSADKTVFADNMTVINQELNAEIPTVYLVSRVTLRDFKIQVYAPADAEVFINEAPCTKISQEGSYALFEADIGFTSTPLCYFELSVTQNGEKETSLKVFDRRDIA